MSEYNDCMKIYKGKELQGDCYPRNPCPPYYHYPPCPPYPPYPPCPPCPPYYPCCCVGPAGADGESAYEIALDHGFAGTEEEWLESLKGEPAPFKSSYIEAVGSSQTVSNGEHFAFDTDPDVLDTVGSAIRLSTDGKEFIISQAGLYRVEWSMNLLTAAEPVLVGLLENGGPSSALSGSASGGPYASGALIHVSEDDLPFTLSLRNYGAPLSITNPLIAENTAISLRISRFADEAAE